MIEPRRIWLASPSHFLAFGFGSGLAPVAPGTFGTLAAIPVYWLLQSLALAPYLLTVLVLFVVGIVICDRTAQALGSHDPSSIVWDELVGFVATMTAAPAVWWAPLAGFIAFRLFDILKPWPIRWVDRKVAGGFGIMLDDLLAAVPAWCVVQLAGRVL